MDKFVLHTSGTTGGETSETLTGIANKLGFVPNMFAVMGGANAALGGFVSLNQYLTRSSLTALEREIIQIAASMENHSPYCVAGHTAFADMQGVDPEAIQTARRNEPVEDGKLEALRVFTRRMVNQKGHLSQQELAAFLVAGYRRDQGFEVIMAIALKFFSNLTGNLTGIPLDDAFRSYAWSPSEARVEAA